jgi:tetratricopeptide (TPR) repeat protein
MAVVTVEQALQHARAYRGAGRMAEAEALLRQIVTGQPGNTSAWHEYGLVLLSTGRYAEALPILQHVVAKSPGEGFPHSDLAVAYSYLGRPEESIATSLRAIELRPDMAHTHRNLADVLYGQGRHDDAIAHYRRAIALAPYDANAYNNLGSVLQKIGRLEEASACYKRAVEIAPDLLEAQSNYGDTLTKLGHLEEGLACCRRVLAMNPAFADAYLNMGVTWSLMGRFPEAEASYRRAIAYRPDFANAHLNLGLLLLLLGRYEEGWPSYEWRWRSPVQAHRLRHFAVPQWDGAPVPGKTILVHGEQGFGDVLLLSRFLPLLRERSKAARLIFECQPALVPFLRQLGGLGIDVVGRDSSEAGLPPFDLHLPLFSAPLTLREFAPIPPITSSLSADPELRARWRGRLGSGSAPRVGIAWAGNPTQDEDRRRSLAPEKFARLLNVPGVEFISLQVEPRRPLPPVIAAAGVRDFSAEISDFADSAALIAELDLVVTVDTATAHLAGTLGRPTWVFTPLMPYWPYAVGGESTPWYPTMRLFRQAAPNDWEPLLERVAAALRALDIPRR